MSSRCRSKPWLCAAFLAIVAQGCESEQRAFRATPAPAADDSVQASDFRAGPPGAAAPAARRATPARLDVETRERLDDQTPRPTPGQLSDTPRASSDGRAHTEKPFQDNRWAVAEGKRLYEWFNCSGCHAPGGGGGMGPSFMDARWRYGDTPDNVFAAIVEGRPQGMPAFRDRIAPADAWKLVAFVRTLGRLTPKDVWPARGDEMAELQFEAPRSRSSGPASAAEPASQPELTP
jgi:cytochrome c oxidase cbb3-type subunit 3